MHHERREDCCVLDFTRALDIVQQRNTERLRVQLLVKKGEVERSSKRDFEPSVNAKQSNHSNVAQAATLETSIALNISRSPTHR